MRKFCFFYFFIICIGGVLCIVTNITVKHISFEIHAINGIEDTRNVVKVYSVKLLTYRTNIVDSISKVELRENVKVLSDDIGVRREGTANDIKTQDWIVEKMEEYGYFVIKQKFPLKEGGKSVNVVAYKDESDEIAHNYIIVGGHFDTEEDSPGAMDNASGISAILEIARVLSEYHLSCSVHFIFFGAEECDDSSCSHSLQGSKYYVQELTEEEERAIVGVINLDNIGDTSQIQLRSDESISSDFRDIMQKAMNERSIDSSALPLSRASDHYSFEKVSIPAIFIYTPSGSFIHTKNDTIENISFQNLLKIVQGVTWSLLQHYRCAE